MSSESDGTVELSAEEKARRERMMIAQATGILQYYWSANSEYILVPAGNTLWMFKVSTGKMEPLPVSDVQAKGEVIDPQLSPDSYYVSYLVSYLREDNNLYVFHLPTRQEIAITTDGSFTIRNGVAEFVAQEEMSRMTGYWRSIHTRYLAFKLKLVEVQRGFSARRESFERLQVQDGGSETTSDLGDLLPSDYIRTPLTESEPNAYVNLVGDSDLYFCSRNKRLCSKKIFFWLSEREAGFESIFIGTYAKVEGDKEPKLFRLTDKIGDKDSPFFGQHYVVDSIEFVDEDNCHLYFTGRKSSPIEKHLNRLDFGQLIDKLDAVDDKVALVECADACITQVTAKNGFHNVSFSPNGLYNTSSC
jgi:dipeptidyl-peptidase-4